MGKVKYYSNDMKEKIIQMHENGQKQAHIAKSLGMYRGTINKIISKYVKRGTTAVAEKTGRPRKTTKRIDNLIKRKATSDPRKTAVQINKEIRQEYKDLVLSDMTIRRRLIDINLHGRRAVKKPLLSKRHRLARLRFAREHLHWTPQMWSNVVFSDESKFNLFGSDGTGYVRRPVGQRYDPKYLIPTVKHGGGNIMVWGCFRRCGTGPIALIKGKMNSQVYIDILEENLLPYEEEHLPLLWTFQQDNDPKHTSKVTQKWFSDNKIKLLDWPSQSPDLNPIENLWYQLDKKIRQNNIKNRDDLWNIIKEEWKNISPDNCAKLVDSMRSRCEAVIKARGFPIKY